jgi:hypothetical protein
MANDQVYLAGSRDLTVMTPAARTATPNTVEVQGGNQDASSGLVVVLDVTAVTATPSLTVNIYGVDRGSGKTWLIATTGALAPGGAATYTVKIHPNNPTSAMSAVSGGAASQSVQGQVPNVVRFEVVHGNANSQTYELGAHYTG